MNKLQYLFQQLELAGVDFIKPQTPNGDTYIKASDLGKYFGLKHPEQYFKKLAKKSNEGHLLKMMPQKNGLGRPALYIPDLIFYSFILTRNSSNKTITQIRDWMFGESLPTIFEVDGEVMF